MILPGIFLVQLREKNNPSVLLLFILPLIIYEYSPGSKNQRGLRPQAYDNLLKAKL